MYTKPYTNNFACEWLFVMLFYDNVYARIPSSIDHTKTSQ